MAADGGPFGGGVPSEAATTVNDGGPRRMDLPPFLPPDRSCAPTAVNEPDTSRWRRDQSPRDRRAESSRYRAPSPCVGGRPWIFAKRGTIGTSPSQAWPRPHRPRGLPGVVMPLAARCYSVPQRDARDVVRLSNEEPPPRRIPQAAPISGGRGHMLDVEFPPFWRRRAHRYGAAHGNGSTAIDRHWK